jgi:hypothetical protein
MSTIDSLRSSLKAESNKWAYGIWEVLNEADVRLQHSAYLELRNITCDFHEGVLTIRGRVPSYFLKQYAQSILLDINGVLELNNQLDVIVPVEARSSNCGPKISYEIPADYSM